MIEFKDRLKQLRKEKGLTQQELADQFNISGVTIMRYEKGQRSPSYRSLRRYESGESDCNGNGLIEIANFFNVTTDYLLGLSDIKRFEINLKEISTDDLLGEIKRRLK